MFMDNQIHRKQKLVKTALAFIALTAYALGSTIQTKMQQHMDLIIIAEQDGGPTVQSYITIMIAFYGCGILATAALLISLIPAYYGPRRSPK